MPMPYHHMIWCVDSIQIVSQFFYRDVLSLILHYKSHTPLPIIISLM